MHTGSAMWKLQLNSFCWKFLNCPWLSTFNWYKCCFLQFIADYFKKDTATEQESCMSLNFLMAFLWREWRDSPQMKSFFLKKMNLEFSELMKGKAARKLIEQITIEELSLGTSLPVIKGALHLFSIILLLLFSYISCYCQENVCEFKPDTHSFSFVAARWLQSRITNDPTMAL